MRSIKAGNLFKSWVGRTATFSRKLLRHGKKDDTRADTRDEGIIT